MIVTTNKTKSRGRPKGLASNAFTLPEVLVSILITTIMVTSLYAGITQVYKMAHQTRDVARATQVMVDTMEILRLYTWEGLNTPGFVPTSYTVQLDADYKGKGTNNTRMAVATIQITNVTFSTGYNTNMKEVTITVDWTNSTLHQSRSMKSYVARNGIQSYIYED